MDNIDKQLGWLSEEDCEKICKNPAFLLPSLPGESLNFYSDSRDLKIKWASVLITKIANDPMDHNKFRKLLTMILNDFEHYEIEYKQDFGQMLVAIDLENNK